MNSDALPANRAFVIQFCQADPDGGVRFVGRVEHLASGQNEHFSSRDELWKIIDRMLIEKHRAKNGGEIDDW